MMSSSKSISKHILRLFPSQPIYVGASSAIEKDPDMRSPLQPNGLIKVRSERFIASSKNELYYKPYKINVECVMPR